MAAINDESDPGNGGLDALEHRLRLTGVVAGPYSHDRVLQLEILLYIGRELHELRTLIEAIDRGRSEW